MNSQYTGLTDSEASLIRKQSGDNSISSNQKSNLKKILLWVFSPISLMLLGAATLSFVIGKTFDFYFIIALYSINFCVGQWQEYKANNAIAELQSTFNIRTLTLRNNTWIKLESTELVAGDIISLRSGDIVPADLLILETNEANIDESSITGESETVIKKVEETAYNGTVVTSGEIVGRVEQTGTNTRFGKTLLLAESGDKKSSIEKDIIKISKFLAVISVVCIIVLSIGLYLRNTSLELIVTTDLSLLIAGIPVAMPTVITLIMSLGLTELAKKKVAVRRLSSLEDLANVNLLLSDKTGTLTHHHIVISKIFPFGELSEKQVLEFASTTTGAEDTYPVSMAIEQRATALGVNLPKADDLIPGDSVRKRTTATAKINGKITTVSVGATQIILQLCKASNKYIELAKTEIEKAAVEGFRTVAVAYNQTTAEEENMTLAGLIFLADEIRDNSKPTIAYLTDQGIAVKMVTGDHTAIAGYVAKKIGLKGEIQNQNSLTKSISDKKTFDSLAGFAEVFPEDKLNIVKSAKNWYKVAVTGDGANDIPAVSAANVGIAVKNAVNALHSAADIVLLTDGIAVIKDAIIEARKIFTRVFFYSVYRISESFRIILSITILGLIYHAYPMSPIHLLLLALLNDIPIISLAYDKVKALNRPSAINVSQRMLLSLLFGGIGLLNSLIFFLLLRHWQIDPGVIQTAFFLKLTVSGHLLIYVTHTEDRWWKFLPDKRVITATVLTQAIATILALFGIFITKLPWELVVLVWVWAFFWMQWSEVVKWLRQKFSSTQLF